MKIAILSFYSGHFQRGAELWVEELARRLSEEHDVTVFQNSKSKQSVYNVVDVGISFNEKIKNRDFDLIRRAFLHYRGRRVASFTFKILGKLWQRNFDIIIPIDGGWQPAFIRILSWLRGSKMVIVGHSGIGWDDRNNLWNFPSCFVALSKPGKKWAEKANPFVKVVHISNGVDLDKFNKDGERVDVELEEPIILTVAAPQRGKRLSLAIEAVSRLKKGSLLLLGGGYEERKIKKLGKSKLKSRFLMQQVPFEEIPKYYRASNVFTLPSWEHEAFGMVYLEAMACGLPVVATDDELRSEIVGNAGILVDPTDIDDYASALEKALKTDWGDKPRKQAEKFSWDKVVKQYEKLFESLVR